MVSCHQPTDARHIIIAIAPYAKSDMIADPIAKPTHEAAALNKGARAPQPCHLDAGLDVVEPQAELHSRPMHRSDTPLHIPDLLANMPPVEQQQDDEPFTALL